MFAPFSIILTLYISLHKLQVPNIWLTWFTIYFFLLKVNKTKDFLKAFVSNLSSYSSKYNIKTTHIELVPNTFQRVIVYTHQVNNIRML